MYTVINKPPIQPGISNNKSTELHFRWKLFISKILSIIFKSNLLYYTVHESEHNEKWCDSSVLSFQCANKYLLGIIAKQVPYFFEKINESEG